MNLLKTPCNLPCLPPPQKKKNKDKKKPNLLHALEQQ